MKIITYFFIASYLCLIAQQLKAQPLSTGAENDRAHRPTGITARVL